MVQAYRPLRPAHNSQHIVWRTHLARGKSGDRGQHAEGVAREEYNGIGMSAHARGLVVVDVINGVRHSRVLRLGHVCVIRLTVRLLTHFFHHKTDV